MYYLVYVSSATRLFTQQELVDLLQVSRRNNEPAQITGMLLYQDGNFMQYLEGPKDAVLTSMARISKDPRHHGIITLLQNETGEREFSDWAMGFKSLDASVPDGNPGYTDFLNTPLDSQKFQSDPSMSMKLLRTFKQKMR